MNATAGDISYNTTLNLLEWLSVTGLAQAVLILVYMASRVRQWRQALLPMVYFSVLGAAFALQFALRIETIADTLRFFLWLAWMMAPVLCYLLVLQIVKLVDLPDRKQFFMLLLIPLVLGAGAVIGKTTNACDPDILFCENLMRWFYWLGSISGGIAMLALFAHRGLFSELWKIKGGKERYWLIIILVVANMVAVGVNLTRSTGTLSPADADALLVLLGIVLVYLAMTSLFRVYPPPLQLASATSKMTFKDLSDAERVLAEQIKKLMELDKVYHEQTFSRADLARELQTSENTLSKVINVTFGKSFPTLLNEFRVEDAKRLLKDPKIPIQTVAFEVGFNSVASFNRVFKDLTGTTPSHYRSMNLGIPEG